MHTLTVKDVRIDENIIRQDRPLAVHAAAG